MIKSMISGSIVPAMVRRSQPKRLLGCTEKELMLSLDFNYHAGEGCMLYLDTDDMALLADGIRAIMAREADAPEFKKELFGVAHRGAEKADVFVYISARFVTWKGLFPQWNVNSERRIWMEITPRLPPYKYDYGVGGMMFELKKMPRLLAVIETARLVVDHHADETRRLNGFPRQYSDPSVVAAVNALNAAATKELLDSYVLAAI